MKTPIKSIDFRSRNLHFANSEELDTSVSLSLLEIEDQELKNKNHAFLCGINIEVVSDEKGRHFGAMSVACKISKKNTNSTLPKLSELLCVSCIGSSSISKEAATLEAEESLGDSLTLLPMKAKYISHCFNYTTAGSKFYTIICIFYTND